MRPTTHETEHEPSLSGLGMLRRLRGFISGEVGWASL